MRDDGLSSTGNQNIPRSDRGYHNRQKSSPSNPAKACWGYIFRVDVRMVGNAEVIPVALQRPLAARTGFRFHYKPLPRLNARRPIRESNIEYAGPT